MQLKDIGDIIYTWKQLENENERRYSSISQNIETIDRHIWI